MAVLKTSFRFPEINLGFVPSARGTGHLTPKKSLERGPFDQRKGPHGGEFDQKNKKCQMPGGQPGGGHGHPWIRLIHLFKTMSSAFLNPFFMPFKMSSSVQVSRALRSRVGSELLLSGRLKNLICIMQLSS